MKVNVRYATEEDTMRIVRGLQNKHLDFNTPAQARHDIEMKSLLVAIIDNKIVGSLAVVNTTHGYKGLKRGCIYNKKNYGKGIMSALFDYALSLGYDTYGCTPWADNSAIIKMISKRGFQYEKTVAEKYLVYVKRKI